MPWYTISQTCDNNDDDRDHDHDDDVMVNSLANRDDGKTATESQPTASASKEGKS